MTHADFCSNTHQFIQFPSLLLVLCRNLLYRRSSLLSKSHAREAGRMPAESGGVCREPDRSVSYIIVIYVNNKKRTSHIVEVDSSM